MKQQQKAIKSVRKTYDFNPAPRVVNSKKLFKRKEKFQKSFDCEDWTLTNRWFSTIYTLAMEKNIQLTANRYNLAAQKVLATWPDWKKKQVEQDIANKNTDSRLMHEYSKEVIKLAESDQEIFLTC